MKLFLEFDLCEDCNSFIDDLTTEESLSSDDITRNQVSAKFMRHLTYNHSEVIQAIVKEVKAQQRKPQFDLYK